MNNHSAFAKHINAYCLGRATKSERNAVEEHLLECDYCWQEVQRLDAAVRALGSDRDLIRSLSVDDIASTFGISNNLHSVFGGHLWPVISSCAVYAALYVVNLFVEIAYQFNQYGATAIKLAPAVFCWMFITSILGLALDWKLATRRKALGLALSILIFIIAAGGLYFALGSFLPPFPITESDVQSYTAQGAYAKDVFYSLILGIFYLSIPFHFIVFMQKELKERRYKFALELLIGDKFKIAPRGVIYIRLSVLGIGLIGMVFYSMYSTPNLMNHLLPGSYMNLFIKLIYLRLILYHGLAVLCLWWYYRTLNELKRECRAFINIPIGEKIK